MNVITKALSEVGFNIPLEVLELAFKENSARYNQTISLDERIMNKVIRPRVLVDCNLVGGVQIVIPIDKCVVEYGVNNEAIITVDKKLTNNKSILSLLGIVSNVSKNLGGYVSDGGSSIMDNAAKISNSLDNLNIIQTSNLELIADNKILVEEYGMGFLNGSLRCMIENSSNLGNISPRSSIKFSKLVLYAVQSYIHNKLRVRIDKGYLYNGHELGIIKEVIDSYADSNELYTNYLDEVWRVVSFMNDTMSHDRFIKSMFGSIV